MFARHARWWTEPLLQLAFDTIVREESFSYFARDLLTAVAEWPADALPDEPRVNALLSHTLERLMVRASAENRQLLLGNVRVVRQLLEKWGAP